MGRSYKRDKRGRFASTRSARIVAGQNRLRSFAEREATSAQAAKALPKIERKLAEQQRLGQRSPNADAVHKARLLSQLRADLTRRELAGNRKARINAARISLVHFAEANAGTTKGRLADRKATQLDHAPGATKPRKRFQKPPATDAAPSRAARIAAGQAVLKKKASALVTFLGQARRGAAAFGDLKDAGRYARGRDRIIALAGLDRKSILALERQGNLNAGQLVLDAKRITRLARRKR